MGIIAKMRGIDSGPSREQLLRPRPEPVPKLPAKPPVPIKRSSIETPPPSPEDLPGPEPIRSGEQPIMGGGTDTEAIVLAPDGQTYRRKVDPSVWADVPGFVPAGVRNVSPPGPDTTVARDAVWRYGGPFLVGAIEWLGGLSPDWGRAVASTVELIDEWSKKRTGTGLEDEMASPGAQVAYVLGSFVPGAKIWGAADKVLKLARAVPGASALTVPWIRRGLRGGATGAIEALGGSPVEEARSPIEGAQWGALADVVFGSLMSKIYKRVAKGSTSVEQEATRLRDLLRKNKSDLGEKYSAVKGILADAIETSPLARPEKDVLLNSIGEKSLSFAEINNVLQRAIKNPADRDATREVVESVLGELIPQTESLRATTALLDAEIERLAGMASSTKAVRPRPMGELPSGLAIGSKVRYKGKPWTLGRPMLINDKPGFVLQRKGQKINITMQKLLEGM